MKKTLIITLALFFVFSFAFTISASEKITITFSHVFTTEHPVHQGVLRANELLKERTNGRIELKIFPSGTYASYKDAIKAVRMGTLDMCPLDTAIDYWPASGVLLGVYVFRDYDHWNKFKQSAIYEEFKKTIGEKVGVKQLDLYNFGFRHVTTKNLKATTPEDFKNFKLRVVNFPPYPEAATVLGAVGTPTPIEDVYMALKTGVTDGQENPFTQIITMKFYEVQKYLILTGHMLATSGTIMSKQKWESLSEKDQQIVEEVFSEEADYIDELVQEQGQQRLSFLKKAGMEVIEIDKTPFMERVPLVLEKYPEWKELYYKIQEIK